MKNAVLNSDAPLTAPADPSPAGRPVGALVQAMRILRFLAAHGAPEGVSVIARASGVNGSTCFNILRTLSTEGVVHFDPATKTYRLGFGVLELATGLLGTNPGELIRPELERLALTHGALICLWHVTDSDRIVLIERAFDPDAIRVDLPRGKRLPALIGAVGRVIAARRALDAGELRRRFATLRWQSPPRFDEYALSVTEAGRLGYGIDRGQLYIGVDTVGAVVCDRQGAPRYGISSITLYGQKDDAQLAAAGRDMAEVCARIGAALFPPGATERQTSISR